MGFCLSVKHNVVIRTGILIGDIPHSEIVEAVEIKIKLCLLIWFLRMQLRVHNKIIFDDS
ncbi:hypothetical protein YC2023_085897 [Brassica napus]